jgi:hypothetical protein
MHGISGIAVLIALHPVFGKIIAGRILFPGMGRRIPDTKKQRHN